MENMGVTIEDLGAFKGQQISMTPLIRKLQVHVQAYVDQEEFLIYPLSIEDVMLGAPWFHHMVSILKVTCGTR